MNIRRERCREKVLWYVKKVYKKIIKYPAVFIAELHTVITYSHEYSSLQKNIVYFRQLFIDI